MTDFTQIPYEAAEAELQRIVERMEEGNLSLDESLELFQQGMVLSRHCQKKLDEAQKKIEKVLKDGAPDATTPFSPEED